MMKPEYKAKWIEALRSGRYQQGREQLRDGDGFCCLGVLCDVVKDEIDAEWNRGLDAFVVGEMPYTGSLPTCVSKFVGGVANEATLIDMNDGDGASFAEIADYIENNL